jgi:hypothetical protein
VAVGLPAGFHHPAAEVYRRIGPPAAHTTDTVIDQITGATQPTPPD